MINNFDCFECERIADIDRLTNEIAVSRMIGDWYMTRLLRKAKKRYESKTYQHTCELSQKEKEE